MALADSFNLTGDSMTKTFWWSRFSDTNRHQVAGDVHVSTGSSTHRDLIQKRKPTGHSSMNNYAAASASCNFPMISANICWKPTVQPHYPAAGWQWSQSEMRDRMGTNHRRERRTGSELFVYKNKIGKNVHCSKRKWRKIIVLVAVIRIIVINDKL